VLGAPRTYDTLGRNATLSRGDSRNERKDLGGLGCPMLDYGAAVGAPSPGDALVTPP